MLGRLDYLRALSPEFPPFLAANAFTRKRPVRWGNFCTNLVGAGDQKCDVSFESNLLLFELNLQDGMCPEWMRVAVAMADVNTEAATNDALMSYGDV